MIALASLLSCVLALTPAGARGNAEQDFVDPRKQSLPRMHRFRLGVQVNYMRLSLATADGGKRSQRFHFTPIMVDLAYQLQVFKYMMVRPSLAFGPNVANSRNAMPVVFHGALHVGYQGRMFGAAAGYGYFVPMGGQPNQNDGLNGLGQPYLFNNHQFDAELSLETRIDRGSLSFQIRMGLVRTHLIHYGIDNIRWWPMPMFNAGWFFGETKRGEQRRLERERKRAAGRRPR